jgi:hypothetical protein
MARRAAGNWAAAGAASVLGLAIAVGGSAVASALIAQNVTEDTNVPEISTVNELPRNLGIAIQGSAVIGGGESVSPITGTEAESQGTGITDESILGHASTGSDNSDSANARSSDNQSGSAKDDGKDKTDVKKPREVTPAVPASPSSNNSHSGGSKPE